jgi:hypothetical protein
LEQRWQDYSSQYDTGVPFKATEKSIIETQCDNAKRFGRKMHIDKHITDPHVIAAFNDMTLQGTAEFVRRDDGALLMVIRSKATEEVVFKVTRTGLYCLARFEV